MSKSEVSTGSEGGDVALRFVNEAGPWRGDMLDGGWRRSEGGREGREESSEDKYALSFHSDRNLSLEAHIDVHKDSGKTIFILRSM